MLEQSCRFGYYYFVCILRVEQEKVDECRVCMQVVSLCILRVEQEKVDEHNNNIIINRRAEKNLGEYHPMNGKHENDNHQKNAMEVCPHLPHPTILAMIIATDPCHNFKTHDSFDSHS